MLAFVAALVLHGGEMQIAPPSRKVVGQKVLDARRTLQFESHALRLVEDGKQKWRIELYGPKEWRWEPSPQGTAIAGWFDTVVVLVAASDGAHTSVELARALTEGERPGAQLSDHRWAGETSIAATVRTAALFDGHRRDVPITADRLGARRLKPSDDLPLADLREQFEAASALAQRRVLLQKIAWSARTASNFRSPGVIAFFVDVARTDPALRTEALIALQAQDWAGWAELLAFAGADPKHDALVLALRRSEKGDFASHRWSVEEQARALKQVLASPVDPPALQVEWLEAFGRQFPDLGEAAVAGAGSPHPEVRAAVLARLEEGVVSPDHLRAALGLLGTTPRVRPVLLDQLAGAAPRTATVQMIAALERTQLTDWPEGCLRLGEHLQASGESRLAAGLFVAGALGAERSGDPLYAELLSHLALNLMARHERAEAHRIITQLEGTLASVCGLSPVDVEVGKLPKCPGRISANGQGAALRRLVP